LPLTVCPLSNQKLCVFPDLKDHNLRNAAGRRPVRHRQLGRPGLLWRLLNENFVQTFAAWTHQLNEVFERFVEHDD
jgi:hypothetical protein